MSYDVSIVCSHCGSDCYSANYTYNMSPMLHDVGLKLNEIEDMPTAEFAKVLEAAIAKLEEDPEKYRKMNPKNGWGNYDGMLSTWLKPLLDACREHVGVISVT